MLNSSPLKLDLKADVIGPINAAQRFGILPAVNNLHGNGTLTERIAVPASFSLPGPGPGPGPGVHARRNSGRQLEIRVRNHMPQFQSNFIYLTLLRITTFA